ncbi:BON domain-containing protein [Streptomyces sp. NPDC006654]|uniref:BON domain-containing protein n=1 Tax=unclassified Streptomyces TaxID=2593676 RepID=UPI0033F5D62F
MVKELLIRAWLPPRSVDVAVEKGLVTLTGHMEHRTETEIAVSTTRRIDGVVDVIDTLTYRLDDSRIREEQALHSAAHDWLRGL